MACKIIFTAGAKGGTGKSNFLKFPITWLQDVGIDPYLIDVDEESRTLSRFFPNALRVEPRRTKSYDIIMNLAETGEHPLIIVDLKAGVGNDMLNWVSDFPDASELAEIGVTMLCVGVITSSPDSVSSFLRWVDFLGRQVRYLVVKNLKDSDAAGLDAASVPFAEYDLTKAALEFRKKYRPATIIMPGLDPEYQGELERMSLTIRDVLARRPGIPELLTPLMVRSKLRNYQASLYAQFDAIKELLLP